MIRPKGEAGTGDVGEAVRHMRTIMGEIRRLENMPREELMTYAKKIGAPYDLVVWIADNGKLPVPNFSAGGVATPADASLMRQLGAEAVFVGSGIFKSENPPRRAKAVVDACTYFDRPDMLVEASRDLGEAMPGIDIRTLPETELMAGRGW
jgi:pyridoxal 5'-phosphate synthase pdxS subunit